MTGWEIAMYLLFKQVAPLHTLYEGKEGKDMSEQAVRTRHLDMLQKRKERDRGRRR